MIKSFSTASKPSAGLWIEARGGAPRLPNAIADSCSVTCMELTIGMPEIVDVLATAVVPDKSTGTSAAWTTLQVS